MYGRHPVIEQLYAAALPFALEGFEEIDMETVKRKYLEKLEAECSDLGSHIIDDWYYDWVRDRFLKFETEKWR